MGVCFVILFKGATSLVAIGFPLSEGDLDLGSPGLRMHLSSWDMNPSFPAEQQLGNNNKRQQGERDLCLA